MKTISLLQPWASLIVAGAKKIETRSWATKHRGPVAIHASARNGNEQQELAQLWRPHIGKFWSAPLPTGAVLSTAKLVEVYKIGPDFCAMMDRILDNHGLTVNPNERHFGNYTPGRYAWILADVVPLPAPVPAKGALYLWEWEPTR